jgi:hypothetical protein
LISQVNKGTERNNINQYFLGDKTGSELYFVGRNGGTEQKTFRLFSEQNNWKIILVEIPALQAIM